jgi:replicative DNA helicase
MTAAQKETSDFRIEHALLATLLEGDAHHIATASEEVTPGDFADSRAELVYSAILALDGEGRKVDALMVCEALSSMGRLAAAGGPAFVASLNNPSGFPNVVEHARNVREKGARRSLRQVGLEVAQLAASDVVDLPTLLEESGRKFNEVLSQRQRATWRPMASLVEDTLNLLDAMKRDGGLMGLGTGFPDVDKILAGMQPGELVVLAARPGVGKTAFAMQVAQNLACGEKPLPVGVFSVEMPSSQLVLRMAAGQARVPLERLRRGRLSPAEEERLSEAMEGLFRAPIHIDDSGDVSPLDLRAKARRLKQQHPTLGLLVLDYLQLVKVRGRVENRQVEVAEISRSLKQLAKELGVPILALSQLNRKVEERKGPPMLSDLRESGAIEQDADVVMFLHREKVDGDDAGGGGNGRGVGGQKAARSVEDAVSVEVHIAKQRNGPVGEAGLVFMPAFTRFESAARSG